MMQLSDSELVGKLMELARAERALLGEVLRLLGEAQARKLYLERGYPSLFDFCVKELHFSECVAFPRIQVTRLMVTVPEVLGDIEGARLSLTLAANAQAFFRRAEKNRNPVSAERQREILRSLHGVSTREGDKILANLFPEAPARQRAHHLGNGKVKVSFTVEEDLFEDVQELFRIRSHTNPEKRWEKLLADLVKLGWKKWHPCGREKRSAGAHYEAGSHEENQRDRPH